MRYSQPLADGYVECDECGHPIEEHHTTGCKTWGDEPCPCPVKLTAREIERIRVREGLPRKWNP